MIIIGADGFIGRHLCRAFPGALPIRRTHLDLASPRLTFSTVGYRYAIIAAAIANPVVCEKEPERTYQCNVEGTLALGKELISRGVCPIFFSSDYVLNDQLEMSPVNVYGKQKAELESRALQLDALVIRLSKVYGLDKGDRTLFDEMAMKLSAKEPIKAAWDQVFAPIYVGDVIHQLTSLMEQNQRGLFTMNGPEFASRLDMAQSLAKKLLVSPSLIQPISLDDLKDGVKRPKELKLCSTQPGLTWQEAIDKVVSNYGT